MRHFAEAMATTLLLPLLVCVVLAALSVALVKADDPYRFYTWTVTSGTLSPLGVPQEVGVGLLLFLWYCESSIGFFVNVCLKVLSLVLPAGYSY